MKFVRISTKKPLLLSFFDSKSGLRVDKLNGLQELLSACDDGKVDIILVKSITRFGRNLYEGILILRHLKAIGVDVWFEQEGMKLLQLSSSVSYELLLIFAEAESEGKSKNIKFTSLDVIYLISYLYSDIVLRFHL